MDFIQGLDPSKLVFAGTVLSFLLSPFTSPPYNLAIFLFGIYAQENKEGTQALQMFTGLLGGSTVFDFVWIISHEQNGLLKISTLLLLLLKVPTFLVFGNMLRHHGAQFVGLGGRDLSGPTIWSMPGGFTSGGREGYQNVDEERPVPSHHTRPPAPHLSSPAQVTPAATGPTPYQTL